MSDWIDITKGISTDMAVWPGNDQPKLERTASYADGAESITSNLTMNLHDGTHVDAPLHFIEGGATAETIDLSALMGPALVVDVGAVAAVTADVLAAVVPLPATRVLIKSDNARAELLDRDSFDTSYVALTADASQWLVDNGVKLVGVDYLSVALWEGDPNTHRNLLRNGVTILEGLELESIEPGEYELLALPLLVIDGEAAPTRALIRPL